MTRPCAAAWGVARRVPINAQAVPTCRPASGAGPVPAPEAAHHEFRQRTSCARGVALQRREIGRAVLLQVRLPRLQQRIERRAVERARADRLRQRHRHLVAPGGLAGIGRVENLAPPLQPDAAQHRLAHRLGGARDLMVEGDQRKQRLAPVGGREHGREVTVVVGSPRERTDGTRARASLRPLPVLPRVCQGIAAALYMDAPRGMRGSMATVHVIGAGMAGLSCAVELVKARQRVVLWEAAAHAGGRCRSFHDATLDRTIDNGNHLILGANPAVFAYLETIGARDDLVGQERAAFPFVDLRSGERWTVRPNAGPVPWWIMAPGRRVPGSRARHYLAGLALARSRDGDTAAERLRGTGPLLERLWEPLTVAVLNASVEEASARLLWPVGAPHLRPGRGGLPRLSHPRRPRPEPGGAGRALRGAGRRPATKQSPAARHRARRARGHGP